MWDEDANTEYAEILDNSTGRFAVQTVDLIKGLQPVLKRGSLLAYLVSMTLRITEIHRVLKPTGSFYLHCDPTVTRVWRWTKDRMQEAYDAGLVVQSKPGIVPSYKRCLDEQRGQVTSRFGEPAN